MINITTNGPWKRLSFFLKGYGQRIKYVESRVGLDIVNALLSKVKELAPSGKEYKPYLDSLHAVELVGKKGSFFGVISDNSKIKIGRILESGAADRTVVYISPATTGLSSEVVEFLSSVNPWPVDLLPHGLKDEAVVFVHRHVSVDEMKFVRRNAVEFIAENRDGFRQLGLTWGTIDKKESVENLSSLPDYMWIALRAEFGINAKAVPHWIPAIKWTVASLKAIAGKDDRTKAALEDPLFRDHTLKNNFGLEIMSASKFNKEVKEFQKRIVK